MDFKLDPNKLWGMVAYSDGGVRPNPGNYGAGVFAYFYELPGKREDELEKSELNQMCAHLASIRKDLGNKLRGSNEEQARKILEEHHYNVITDSKIKPIKVTDGLAVNYFTHTTTGFIRSDRDGLAIDTIGRGAIRVNPTHVMTLAATTGEIQTNNYAEMDAFTKSLEIALKLGVKRLHILSDSDYTLKGLEGRIQNWINNGWKTQQGADVANRQSWEKIWNLYNEFLKDGYFSSSWVKGHLGHAGNIHADHLATIGVIKSIRGNFSEDPIFYSTKDYWEPKRDRHPLLSSKRLYFNRVLDRNTPGHYMMADPGKDDELIGKPMAEVSYAIVRMNEPDPIIQPVIDAQGLYGQEFNIVMMIKVEDIYSPYSYRLINDYGRDAMLRIRNNDHVSFPDERQATIARKPIGVTMRAVDSLNILEDLLDKYLAIRSNPDTDNHMCIQDHDLTNDFYDLVEKKRPGNKTETKRVFKKEFGVGHKSHTVTKTVSGLEKEDREFTFYLKLGLDLPDRNNLKRLEDHDPDVRLITWRESVNTLRYAVILECNEGMAIWSNFYADKIIFKST